MSFAKSLPLNTGGAIPQIGFGTWQSAPREVKDAVVQAVQGGYRHLDLARIYENQEEIGVALKEVIPSVVKREDLFITSKLWNSSHRPEYVEKELNLTLEQLGIDYLDLYLIHWPVAFIPGSKVNTLFPPHPTKPGEVEIDTTVSLVETWKEVIKLPATGKVKAVGVSNFTIKQLKAIIAATGVVPAANQIEAHPYLPQDDLVAYCNENKIHITAYSPLGNNTIGAPLLIDLPLVKEIAEKIGATPAQVLIAWGAQRGYSIIPKSVKKERIISNFKQVELPKEDYERLTSYGAANLFRFNVPSVVNKPKWDIDIFDEPSEANTAHKVKIV